MPTPSRASAASRRGTELHADAAREHNGNIDSFIKHVAPRPEPDRTQFPTTSGALNTPPLPPLNQSNATQTSTRVMPGCAVPTGTLDITSPAHTAHPVRGAASEAMGPAPTASGGASDSLFERAQLLEV